VEARGLQTAIVSHKQGYARGGHENERERHETQGIIIIKNEVEERI